MHIKIHNCVLCLTYNFVSQDNYFEEAFKMRNVLEEFRKSRRKSRKPSILGLREHIFTGRFALYLFNMTLISIKNSKPN